MSRMKKVEVEVEVEGDESVAWPWTVPCASPIRMFAFAQHPCPHDEQSPLMPAETERVFYSAEQNAFSTLNSIRPRFTSKFRSGIALR